MRAEHAEDRGWVLAKLAIVNNVYNFVTPLLSLKHTRDHHEMCRKVTGSEGENQPNGPQRKIHEE
jgi:hypothetical protein